MSADRTLTIAYRPSDDVLQVATEVDAPGDIMNIGGGISLAIARDDGRPIGVLVAFRKNSWDRMIDTLAGHCVAHLQDVRRQAVAEGIRNAVANSAGKKMAAAVMS